MPGSRYNNKPTKNMKYLLSVFCCLYFISLSAQVTVQSIDYKKQSLESLQVEIDAEKDLVEDLWDDFWDDRYNIDVDKFDNDKRGTAYLAEQVSVPLISVKNFDLYSKIEDRGNKSNVSMAVSFTEGSAINKRSNAEAYDAAEAIMTEFRTYFYTRYFDDKLNEARDQLTDIRDDSQDANEDAIKAREKIEKYEDKIAKLQRKIEKEREKAGDEFETAEEKSRRAKELEERIRSIEEMRARYLGK